MDFKVAGTRDGVTAIQMDIKTHGITQEVMKEALAKAHAARYAILDTMEQAIPRPRPQLSKYAPLITSIVIDKDKIREVIGPGGKVVRDIQEKTGASINIEDDGTVQIVGSTKEQSDAALRMIEGIVADPEVGAVYEAKVKSIVDFGAFVEFLPGKEGLVHISELENRRVGRVEDVLNIGDTVKASTATGRYGSAVRLCSTNRHSTAGSVAVCSPAPAGMPAALRPRPYSMSSPQCIGARRLEHGEGLPCPGRATPGSSGCDIAAAVDSEISIQPGARALIPSGFCLQIPPGLEVQVRSRSGLAHTHGVMVLNSPGTIDSDYRGEVKVILANFGSEPFTVKRGDRIAQLVPMAVPHDVGFEEVAEIGETARGAGGFGHSGT
jgi:deoxyuridine 5'-triphosphate nucleotidohydrolase